MQEYSVFRDLSLDKLVVEEKGSELWKVAVGCGHCLILHC